MKDTNESIDAGFPLGTSNLTTTSFVCKHSLGKSSTSFSETSGDILVKYTQKLSDLAASSLDTLLAVCPVPQKIFGGCSVDTDTSSSRIRLVLGVGRVLNWKQRGAGESRAGDSL